MKGAEEFSFDFHRGKAVIYFSHFYSEPNQVVKEILQNAIDKHAKHILLEMDCMGNDIRGGKITCQDDGDGASKGEIVKKFREICSSLKIDDPDALGHKGIGIFAGIAIAGLFKLVTKEIQNKFDTFRVFYFGREDLEKDQCAGFKVEDWQAKIVAPHSNFPVSAMLCLEKVNQAALRSLVDLNELERFITDAFNSKILKNQIEIRLCYRNEKGKKTERIVKPMQFRGMRINSEKYETTFGLVNFDFFYNTKPVEKPRILIERIGAPSFSLFNLFHRKQLDEKATMVYSRGYFEGRVTVNFCTQVASHDSFEWDRELEVFVDILSRFALQILDPVIKQFEDEQRQDKYKKASDAALKRFDDFFKTNPNLIPPKFKSHFIEPFPGGVQTIKKKKPIRKPRVDPTILRAQRTKVEGKPPTEKRPSDQPNPEQQGGGIKKAKEGLELRYVVPKDIESGGFYWHSRTTSDGHIEVNMVHSDFLKSELLGMSRLVEYIFVLLVKELTCGTLDPAAAGIFCEKFERTYMGFWRAALIKAE